MKKMKKKLYHHEISKEIINSKKKKINSNIKKRK